jgi:predicted RNA binding protein YcfA (HicA-like mRNA interferase family)
MARLPRPSGRQMVSFLESQGFTVVRVRGSHHVMARETQRTSIPIHGNRALKIGTLRGILRDIEMSPDEFERLWDKR